MRPTILPSQASICQLCKSIVIRRSIESNAAFPGSTYRVRSRQLTTTRSIRQKSPKGISNGISTRVERGTQNAPISQSLQNTGGPRLQNQSILDTDIEDVHLLRNEILSSTSTPSEHLIMEALERCEAVANNLINPSEQLLSDKNTPATTALLSVDKKSPVPSTTKILKFSPAMIRYTNHLSDIAYSVLKHPSVFISPPILAQYVKLQSLLRIPESFPEIFTLYASKPVPEAESSPPKYRQGNPNSVANAVQSAVADLALQSAIDRKELVIAMDIVETTYATKAFRRNKIAREGLFPLSIFTATPFAVYGMASMFSTYQTTVDPAEATTVAFAGIMAYIGFTSILGIVAVTTGNDHMDRVTWAPGTPLRERWMREPERAAVDRIAGAWGFRQSWKKGEEEGEEWDALREWIGRKRMVLDQFDLLEGME